MRKRMQSSLYVVFTITVIKNATCKVVSAASLTIAYLTGLGLKDSKIDSDLCPSR